MREYRKGQWTKVWAYGSFALVAGVIGFLFLYVFWEGASSLSWEFLFQNPKGLVLGQEGGIAPAIVGSLFFTGLALILVVLPAWAVAVYTVFFSRSRLTRRLIRLVIHCLAGVPSIVLGLFSYSFLVRRLGLGRCLFSASVGLAIMILPFVEIRAEKAFAEVPTERLTAAYALGCSRAYILRRLVWNDCRGELISGLILAGCYAMGATAPLMFTGGVAFAPIPDSIFKPAMALPLHLYLLVAQGEPSLPVAYGTSLVMMGVILLGNLLASLYAWRKNKG